MNQLRVIQAFGKNKCTKESKKEKLKVPYAKIQKAVKVASIPSG
jgi:hypothetical protein